MTIHFPPCYLINQPLDLSLVDKLATVLHYLGRAF